MARITQLDNRSLLDEIGALGKVVDNADKAVDRNKWALAEAVGVALDRGLTLADIAVKWNRAKSTIRNYGRVWDTYAAEAKRPKFYVAIDLVSMSPDQREAAEAVADVVGSTPKAVRQSRREEVAETRRRLADPDIRREVLADPDVVRQVARGVVESKQGDAEVARARVQRDNRRANESDASRGYPLGSTGKSKVGSLTHGISVVSNLATAAASVSTASRAMETGGVDDDWRDDALAALDDIDAAVAVARQLLAGATDIDAELAKITGGGAHE